MVLYTQREVIKSENAPFSRQQVGESEKPHTCDVCPLDVTTRIRGEALTRCVAQNILDLGP